MPANPSNHLFQPLVKGEQTEIISVRVPKSWMPQINSVIAASGKPKAEYLRDLVENTFFGTSSSSTSPAQNLQSVEQPTQDLSSNNLVEPSLADKIMEKYPTPIALACRRFHNAQLNVYEQMRRLIDLYEYTTFFVFNLVLADLFQRLDPIYIKDKGVRNAFKDFSMERRIKFMEEVIKVASTGHGTSLFIPELVDSAVTNYANNLKELRNELAHKGTASESVQRRILDKKKPIIDELLCELKFLIDYRLVRIPGLHYEGGQLIYQMMVYQGEVPFLDTKPIGGDLQLERSCLADRNHLVILNNQGKVLDLHPLYQLVSNEKTQDEEHMCFLKQCKDQEKRVYVESIQTSAVFALDGLDALKELAEVKLLAQPPNS